MAAKTKIEKLIERERNQEPKFGPPDPVPKKGDTVLYITGEHAADERSAILTKVVDVAPDLEGRVIDIEAEMLRPRAQKLGLQVSPVTMENAETAKRKEVVVIRNAAFYPVDVMEQEGYLTGNTWHWPETPAA
jgi:hypothetical protein